MTDLDLKLHITKEGTILPLIGIKREKHIQKVLPLDLPGIKDLPIEEKPKRKKRGKKNV